MVDAAGLLRRPVAADNAAMESEPKRKRRWFQFSLRSLLIVTMICAIGSAWVARKMERKRLERAAIEAILKLGGNVEYDYQLVKPFPPSFSRTAEPYGPAWMRRLLGENFFSEVNGVFLYGANVTDDELVNLKWFTEAVCLMLEKNNITDIGLVNLKGLTRLYALSLDVTNVGDAGLENLGGMDELRYLGLKSSKVTNAGLVHLKGLRRLRYLDVSDTRVTDAGVKDLQIALPNCKILCQQSSRR
jgi:Leucine Rich repeat